MLLVNVCAMLLPQLDEQVLPPVIPAVCTTAQVNVPPAVLLKAILVVLPLHIETVEGVAVTTGIGCTVTTAVAAAVQLLAVPVIV